MPGSKPGERRGGRQKGTPNKSRITLEKAMNEACKVIPAAEIDSMKPAEFLDRAWRELAKAGFGQAALSTAEKAAPYFSAKLGPVPPAPQITPEDLRRVADLARSEAARRGIDIEGAASPAERAMPN